MVAFVLALSLAATEPPDPLPRPEVSLPDSPSKPELSVPDPREPELSFAPPPAAVFRLEPPRTPGPFVAAELAGAAAGTALADLALVGAGWAALELFERDTVSPTADNFRRAAYILGVSALVVPPLTAALIGYWAGPGRGGIWRAWFVGLIGQAAAITAGLLAAPHVWVALPTQLVTVSVATSLGLYWGRRSARDAPGAEVAPEPEPAPAPVARARTTCPIG